MTFGTIAREAPPDRRGPVAAAQARVLGVSLQVANRPEGGAAVTVELSDRSPTEEPEL